MKKRLYGLLLCLSGFAIGETAPQPRLIDGISIHQQQLVFASAGQLWQVPRSGGQAKPLTSGRTGHIYDSLPLFSPDGSKIAFMRSSRGNKDVYTLNLADQQIDRLTYYPADDRPVSWSHDSQHLNFSSQRGVGQSYQLFRVKAKAHAFATKHPTRWGDSMSESATGTIAYVPLSNRSEFRYYRGGKQAQIHLVTAQDGQWQPQEIISLPQANLYAPQWLGEQLYYLSDQDGSANLYRRHQHQSQQLTHFKRHGVRAFVADHQGIVLIADGQIQQLSPTAKQPQPIEIQFGENNKLKRTRRINVANHISSVSVANSGQQYAITARGDVFISDSRTGQSSNLTQSAANDKNAALSPDGQWVAYFSDQSGHYQLAIRSLNQSSPVQYHSIEANPSFYRGINWSPDSQKLVFSDNRLKLWLFDRNSAQFSQITQSQFSAQSQYQVSWSHDSQLLAYGRKDAHGISQIFAYQLNQARSQPLSPSGQFADLPLFDPSGRYLYYYASPNGHTTDYGWAVLNGYQQRSAHRGQLKMVVLKADQPAPILPGIDLPNLEVDIDQVISPVSIDSEQLFQRTFTLGPLDHSVAALNALGPGKIQLITRSWETPVRLQAKAQYQLHQYDLRNPSQLKQQLKQLQNITLSANGHWGYYQKADNFYLSPLSQAIPKVNPVPRLNLFKTLEPALEWQQIFNEAYNVLRQQMYDPNLHGVDPHQLYHDYSRYLPTISSRQQLQRLLKQMAGFVSVSHTRIGLGDSGVGPMKDQAIGLLGAEYHIEHNRYRFSRVYRNATGQNPAFAPLSQYGSKVNPGDYLIAVNNKNVTSAKNLYYYFNNTAEQVILLTVADNPQGKNSRKLQVKTLSDEQRLRTADWAETNQAYVNQQTNGQIKYVHFYRANQQGIENVLAEFYHLGNAKGFIIDVRFNRGGITVDRLIELLQRKGIYKYRFRQGVDLSTPVNAFEGQTTIIINQFNASAAETFAQMFKVAKLGEVVGKPTYGAGIGPYAFFFRLIDGAHIQIPNRGSYLANGQWTIENRGIHPSIAIDANLYRLEPAHDLQLEAAIKANQAQQAKHQPQQWQTPEYVIHPGLKDDQ